MDFSVEVLIFTQDNVLYAVKGKLQLFNILSLISYSLPLFNFPAL